MTTVVQLNVGGQNFSTSLTTVSKESDSMLAKIIEDRWDLKKVESGQAIFIDRDSTYFVYILNYLRDGPYVILPKDEESLMRIKMESEFYQLNGLKQLILQLLRKMGSSKLWNPKIGDMVQWKENLIESFEPFFTGFTNGYYFSPYESMVIKRKPNSDYKVSPRYGYIDTGSVYEIKVREYECFVCKEPTYLKISRKSFTQDKWSSGNEDGEDDDYERYKSRFLMISIHGEVEELLNGTCAMVKWIASGPVFTTVYVNERGNMQKCNTRTSRFHVPFTALKPKSA